MSLGQPNCFICLNTSLEYVHLEATLPTSDGVHSYEQLLHKCAEIQLDIDEYLCIRCASALETTYEFLELAKKAAHRHRSRVLIELPDCDLEDHMKHQGDNMEQIVPKNVDLEQAEQLDVDLGQMEHLDYGQVQMKHQDVYSDQVLRQEKQTCEVGCYEEEVTAVINETRGMSEGIPAIEQVEESERLNEDDLIEYVGDDESDGITAKSYSDDPDSYVTTKSVKTNAHKEMHKCHQCPAVFPKASLRRKHLWLRHKSLDTCLVCLNEFAPDESLTSHLQQRHSHVRKCSQCDYEDRDDKVGMHERSVHLTDTLYQCHLCEENYSYTEYATHLRSNCAKPPKKHSAACQICGKKFVSQSYLRTHMEAHAQQREEYACPDCDKRYLLKSSLETHRRIHLGETFNCQVCHKQFVRPNELRIHMRFHDGVAPYECELCPRSFTIQSHWRAHMWSHENKKLKCNECGKLFKTSKALHEHSFTHTGMPFECRECGRGCSSRQKLRNHLRSVHKLEPSNEDVESMRVVTAPRRKKINVVVDTSVDGDFMEGLANEDADEPEEMPSISEEQAYSHILNIESNQRKEADDLYGFMVDGELGLYGETTGAFDSVS